MFIYPYEFVYILYIYMYMLHTYVNIKARQITCYLGTHFCQKNTEMWIFNPALFEEDNIALCIFEK